LLVILFSLYYGGEVFTRRGRGVTFISDVVEETPVNMGKIPIGNFGGTK
jgi:hypothetical protein